jgi:hypothetical protein
MEILVFFKRSSGIQSGKCLVVSGDTLYTRDIPTSQVSASYTTYIARCEDIQYAHVYYQNSSGEWQLTYYDENFEQVHSTPIIVNASWRTFSIDSSYQYFSIGSSSDGMSRYMYFTLR